MKMKRLRILSKPTAVKDLKNFDFDSFSDTWRFKADRLQARRWRQFKHQWV